MKASLAKLSAVTIIFFASFSAAYYPGETIVIPNEMGIENLVYTITGNSTPVILPEIEINVSNISIHFSTEMAPDVFDIVFVENLTNTVVQTVYSSGGTRYVDRNVTVIQPLFFDRNITTIVEVEKEVEKVVEKLVDVCDESSLLQRLLIIIAMSVALLALLTHIVRHKKSSPIEETDIKTYKGGEK